MDASLAGVLAVVAWNMADPLNRILTAKRQEAIADGGRGRGV